MEHFVEFEDVCKYYQTGANFQKLNTSRRKT